MVSVRTLLILHGIAASAHISQGVALSVLVARNTAKSYKWPITTLGWEKVLKDKTVRFDIGLLLPSFPFLSGLNHIIAVSSPHWYENDILKNKVNYVRWIEFSLSSSVMLWMLAMLCGVTELRSLISLMIMNVTLMMLGWMIEKRKAEGASRREIISLLVIAWGVFAAQWVQLTMSFFTIVADGTTKPPDIVYSIIGIQFALFSSFGILQVLYCFDVIGFPNYEAGFIGLSLGSKSLLSWLVYGGVISGNKRFIDEKPENEITV
jgi:hypothetical protein